MACEDKESRLKVVGAPQRTVSQIASCALDDADPIYQLRWPQNSWSQTCLRSAELIVRGLLAL